MGVPLAMEALRERAAIMRESLQKSQTITDNMVSILGSFDHRLSALETAMRPTQVLRLSPSESSVFHSFTFLWCANVLVFLVKLIEFATTQFSDFIFCVACLRLGRTRFGERMRISIRHWRRQRLYCHNSIFHVRLVCSFSFLCVCRMYYSHVVRDNFLLPVNREYHRKNFLHLVYVENDTKENLNCSLILSFPLV